MNYFLRYFLHFSILFLTVPEGKCGLDEKATCAMFPDHAKCSSWCEKLNEYAKLYHENQYNYDQVMYTLSTSIVAFFVFYIFYKCASNKKTASDRAEKLLQIKNAKLLKKREQNMKKGMKDLKMIYQEKTAKLKEELQMSSDIYGVLRSSETKEKFAKFFERRVLETHNDAMTTNKDEVQIIEKSIRIGPLVVDFLPAPSVDKKNTFNTKVNKLKKISYQKSKNVDYMLGDDDDVFNITRRSSSTNVISMKKKKKSPRTKHTTPVGKTIKKKKSARTKKQ